MLETSKSAIFDKNVNYPAPKKIIARKVASVRIWCHAMMDWCW